MVTSNLHFANKDTSSTCQSPPKTKKNEKVQSKKCKFRRRSTCPRSNVTWRGFNFLLRGHTQAVTLYFISDDPGSDPLSHPRRHIQDDVKLAQLVRARDCQSRGRWFDSSINSKNENSNLHGFEVHRPSSKGTKSLFQVLKAIIHQRRHLYPGNCFKIRRAVMQTPWPWQLPLKIHRDTDSCYFIAVVTARGYPSLVCRIDSDWFHLSVVTCLTAFVVHLVKGRDR